MSKKMQKHMADFQRLALCVHVLYILHQSESECTVWQPEKELQMEQLDEIKMARILNQESEIFNMAIVSRAEVARRVGKMFSNDRDVWEACGYLADPGDSDYWDFFDRDGLASAIVRAYPEECWTDNPYITDSPTTVTTKFEKAVSDLVKSAKLFHYLERVDILAGAGSYAILLLGFDDGRSVSSEVRRAKKLLYMQPIPCKDIEDMPLNENTSSPDYGKPLYYQINGKKWHPSRVIHVAENCLISDVYGTPRIKNVFNRLYDIQKILGSSAEMFWRGGFPGFSVEADPEATITDAVKTDIKDEVEEYVHDLTRFMLFQGVKVNQLKPMIADPRPHMSIQIEMISAITRIPKRILMGSERGELSSAQDERAFTKHVVHRRLQFCSPTILRPLIQRLIDVGVLPMPRKGVFEIEWKQDESLDPVEASEILEAKSKALSIFTKVSPSAIMTTKRFLQEIFGFSPEKAQEVVDEVIQEYGDIDEQNSRKSVMPPDDDRGGLRPDDDGTRDSI